ncbi:MAG TPA: glycosyltransferase [Gemmatimonadaceae bacterium]
MISVANGQASRTVLHRTDTFVGRTTNWLYDHLRCIPRHEPVVLCDELANRDEFPLLRARGGNAERLSHRVWRRAMGSRPFPTDAQWLRRARPALLHSHFGHVAVGDFPLQKFLGVPWVVSFYGADVYEVSRSPEWQAPYERLFADARRVLALGPYMAQALAALGCAPEKVAVHPLGVDVDLIPHRERELTQGTPLRILFAGTFREKKGIEFVIRGAAQARKAGVPLHVTLVGDAAAKPGDTQTKENVFREIAALGMTNAVTHHPYVEFHTLMDIALASHVFVAPSVTSASGDAEGTPFVLQQMMATGMPVIATAHSDIPYIFGDQRRQLVRERDADAIAERLAYYADDPSRLVVDGAAMAKQIRERFDVRTCAARLSNMYDDLAA